MLKIYQKKQHKYIFVLYILIFFSLVILILPQILNKTFIYSDRIEIYNRIKLTTDPGIQLGHFVLYNTDMKIIIKHWHLRSIGRRSCSYMPVLEMKNGQSFTINSKLERYLIETIGVQVKNTTDGLTIQCF